MQDFKKLVVWQKAFALIPLYYKHTASFPPDERYILTSQIKRAVLSISNNIAEGCGRFTQNDLAHFLQIALGSTTEVENSILAAQVLGYLTEEAFLELNNSNMEVRKMLISLIYKIRAN